MPPIIGIYKIQHVETGNIYVGQSVNITRRINRHRTQLNKKTHHNSHLQSAWEIYGEEAFAFEVLEFCDVKMLTSLEQKWIDILNPFFNIAKVAG